MSPQLNEVSLLALIACDASYARSSVPGATLASYPDSQVELDYPPTAAFAGAGIPWRWSDGVLELTEWTLIDRIEHSHTGFHAQFYRSNDDSRLIVAFTGTNGGNAQDWWTDINLGVFTAKLDPAKSISATSERLAIRHHVFENIRFKDFVRAHMWFNLAAASSSDDSRDTAIENRDRIASEMTAEQIATAEEMARRCQESKLKNCD